MGNGCPFTSIANFLASGPHALMQASYPWASRSPMPSRAQVISSSFTMASALPKFSFIPPVSDSSMIPFSKHSMAKETIMPPPIVSRPSALQMALPLATASRFPTPQFDPKAPAVSYSGPP